MHFFLSQEMRGTPRTDDCIETHALLTINRKFLLSLTVADSDSVTDFLFEAHSSKYDFPV